MNIQELLILLNIPKSGGMKIVIEIWSFIDKLGGLMIEKNLKIQLRQ